MDCTVLLSAGGPRGWRGVSLEPLAVVDMGGCGACSCDWMGRESRGRLGGRADKVGKLDLGKFCFSGLGSGEEELEEEEESESESESEESELSLSDVFLEFRASRGFEFVLSEYPNV